MKESKRQHVLYSVGLGSRSTKLDTLLRDGRRVRQCLEIDHHIVEWSLQNGSFFLKMVLFLEISISSRSVPWNCDSKTKRRQQRSQEFKLLLFVPGTSNKHTLLKSDSSLKITAIQW